MKGLYAGKLLIVNVFYSAGSLVLNAIKKYVKNK